MSTAGAVVSRARAVSASGLWIVSGAGVFIVALTGSAIVVPQLRRLHLLQAVIYIAVAILGWRGSAWAVGSGIAIATFWNSLQLFVTHNIQRGLALIWFFVHTGKIRQLDTMMVPLGALGHFIMIAACVSAFLQQDKEHRSWWKILGGGLIVLAYFALIVAVALPHQGR